MRILLVGLIFAGTGPIWGQASSLPEAPAPVASASVPSDSRWQRVESLPAGELVELRDRATGVKTECVLAYASASAVGCDTGGQYDPARRVVYPKAGIDTVWVVRWVHGPSGKAMLIGAGVGGLLGGLVLAQSQGSAGQVTAGVGIGGLLGVACSNLGDPFYTRMSKRSHLVYRAR
jgi:hypothetical protein